MRRVAGRRLLLGVVALCGLLAGLGLGSTVSEAPSPVPAWCFDGQRWLGYADGIPGSASEVEFSACLSAAAARGEIRSLTGELIDDGLLLDAGGGSFIWPSRESSLYITAYDDRIMIRDSCDREIAVQDGSTSIASPGYPCAGPGRIYEVDRSVTNPDFIIYFVPRTFVIDAEDNWIHVGYTPESLGESYPNRWGEITLLSRPPGLWLRHDVLIQAPTGGYGRSFHQPIAGTGPEVGRYRFEDWFHTVRSELVFGHPAVRRFEEAGRDLLPDREAYARAAQGWIDAIAEDLFAGRVAPVTFSMPAHGDVWLDVAQRTVWSRHPGMTRILLELARLFVHPDPGHGDRAAATFLMLLERYAPEFDAEFARQLARDYQVPVGDPIEAEPVSERTQTVLRLLSQPAPQLPSDHEPIPPEQHLGTTELVVVESYQWSSEVSIIRQPNCYVTSRYTDGTLTTSAYGLEGSFTIGAGRHWNGLRIGEASGPETRSIYLQGVPTAPGRVRVEVTTRCTDDTYRQPPTVLGYVEVIVADSKHE